MKKKIRNLWIKALKGNAVAYRKLAILFLQGKECKKDMALAKLCLDKAAELGDEAGYLIYHRMFSRGKKVIDDLSYRDMRRDYRKTKDWREKRRLGRYLRLEEVTAFSSEKWWNP